MNLQSYREGNFESLPSLAPDNISYLTSLQVNSTRHPGRSGAAPGRSILLEHIVLHRDQVVGTVLDVSGHLALVHQVHRIEGARFQLLPDVLFLAFDDVIRQAVANDSVLLVVRASYQFIVHIATGG